MSYVYGYVCCPYCSHSVIDSKFKRAKFTISPLEFEIYTQREQRSDKGWPHGKGKGKRGFFHVEGSGKTIIELFSGSEEEREIAERIIRRIETIYKFYRSAGLVK